VVLVLVGVKPLVVVEKAKQPVQAKDVLETLKGDKLL
jgi:hypothetical protein